MTAIEGHDWPILDELTVLREVLVAAHTARVYLHDDFSQVMS